MNYLKKLLKRQYKKLIFCIYIITPISSTLAQEFKEKSYENDEGIKSSVFATTSIFVFNPLPLKPFTFSMPIDSLYHPKGILKSPILQRKVITKVSLDWSTITIYETIGDQLYQIPYTSSLQWYFKSFKRQKWHLKLLEMMHKKEKEGTEGEEEEEEEENGEQ